MLVLQYQGSITLYINMIASARSGFRKKEGKLLVFAEGERLMIESWPELSTVTTRARTKNCERSFRCFACYDQRGEALEPSHRSGQAT